MNYFIKRAVLFLILIIFSLSVVSAGKAQSACVSPVFSNGTEFQSGRNPFWLDSGDVNNDGKLDAVSANFEAGGINNTISVFLGDGAGGFSSNTQFTTGPYPTAVTLKDLNADGNLDAVVLNQTDSKMTTMLGNGAGAFTILTQYPIYNAFVVEPVDVNHDSKIDLLVSAGDSYIAKMYFYPGIGDGSFAAPVVMTFPGNFNSPTSPSFADFNHDGETDFVYITGNGVSFWSGDGAGNFMQIWTVYQPSGGLLAGNLNNDAHTDFLIFNDRVTIFLGNGNGTFNVGDSYDIGSFSTYSKLADLNADGFNDIISAHWTANEISVRLGAGDGRFGLPKYQTVANKPRGLVVGDYTSDGKPDVITTSFRNNTMMLTPGKGDGTFRAPTNIKNAQDTYSNSSVAADLNGDGRDDFVTANSSYFGIYVYLRNGNFKFSAPRKYLPSTYIKSVNTGDFNRDGKLDLVAVGGTEGRILLGDGFGNFSALPLFPIGTQGGFAGFVDSADFNGDQKLDLVVSNRDHGSVLIFFGNGDATFSAPTTYQPQGLGQLYEIAIGDYNADGKKDLAIVSDNDISANGKIQIRLNAGNGTFPTQTEYIIGQSIHPRGILTADFNRDGKLDIAVSTITDTVNPFDIYIFNGNGNGTFATQPLRYSTGALSPWDLVAKDFNNDGKLDIATSNYSSEDVTVFAGNGDSTFTHVQRISAGELPVGITSGNFNNDASPDLLVTTKGELTLIPNECNKTADSKPSYDFDGDGKTDISIFRPAQGEWWLSKSSDGTNRVFQFGSASDKLVPADFTGDGRTDVAFWRPSTGEWFILRSEDNSFYSFPFGTNGDTPVAADFDADGKADAGVFRASNQTWFIQKSSGGTLIRQFGAAGDKPVPADYDGDGKTDIAISRTGGANGAEWWIQRSSNQIVFATQFGASSDKAVQGDYTGDGKADIAVWKPENGFWFILRSEDFSFYAFPFGANGDLPVGGDYDGDGKVDAGVFRPTNSTWYVQRSTAGTLIQQFGSTGDLPVPNAFVP